MNLTDCCVRDLYLGLLGKMFGKRLVSCCLFFGLLTILCHAKTDPSPNRHGLPSTERVSGDVLVSKNITSFENDPPVITGQSSTPLTTEEDHAITIALGDLIVTDPDNVYPADFTLQLYAGSNYTFSGTVITPDPNFNGSLVVPVTVNDGTNTSNTFNLQINVTPVNDAPVIASQNPDPLVTNEDEALAITLAQLVVNDVDNAYPTGFSLQVLPGTHYAVSGSTITPDVNFAGTLNVAVSVSDGMATSNTFNVIVDVRAINDPPVINGQSPDPLLTAEDQPITIQFSNLLVADPDNAYPGSFVLTISTGADYSVSGNTITPSPNFSGTLVVPVIVNDGVANSNSFSLAIEVTPANDAPLITGQNPLAVNEDNSINILLSDIQVTDADGNYPSGYTLSLGSGLNYSISGATVIPATDFYGSLTVPVTVNDGTTNSNPFNLMITVNAVNDAPVIIGQNPITISENQSLEISFSHLLVTDPDDEYPGTFTLSVSPGANYTVTNSTITPAQGFSGELRIGVVVNDGKENSNPFDLRINVTEVNDPPVIVAQNALSVLEDNSLTILLSDLSVNDPDNAYPAGFTLIISPGTNYSTSSNSITPALNFTGTLSVPVQVNDGTSNSQLFNLQISVLPVNDAPQISGQQPLSVMEDQAITLEPGNFTVADPDNIYPTGFTLTISAGANYTVSGNTITPSPDFAGMLRVPVQVNDGALNSNIFEAQITVNAGNDPPVITGQLPLNTSEDTPVTIRLTDLTVMDPDNTYPIGFRLSIAPGQNYSAVGATITPGQDFTGTLNITLTVNDGVSDSNPFVFQIQVGDSNDPPLITGQSPLSANEEETLTLMLSHLTVVDPDNPYPSGFSILISDGINYSVAGNNITPAMNFAGVLVVPVRVNDGVNNSPTFDLQLTVNPINDPPSFTAIPDQRIAENSAATTLTLSNISKGPGEDDQQLTISASSGNTLIIPNPTVVYNSQTNTATITFKPVDNVSGSVTVTVIAVDNGPGTAPNQNSFSRTFQIEVTEINAAPTLEPISDRTVQEDAPVQTIPLTGITAGAGENQPLLVEVSTDRPDLFESLSTVYTSPQPTGTLLVTPKANAYGIAKISVKITDNGSSTWPSVNTIVRTFSFTLQPVNDPPVFSSVPKTVAAVNELYDYMVEVKDVESVSLPITGVSVPPWATLTNLGGGKARLSGIPVAQSTGNIVVTLQVSDAGIIVQQQFTLLVNTRPTVAPSDIGVSEDELFQFDNSFFSASYKDANQQALVRILITQLPANGKLLLDGNEIHLYDTIASSRLGAISYQPLENFYGRDSFQWKANDGYHYSLAAAMVNIEIRPVNDPPSFSFETDSLHFEVNGEAKFLTELFQIDDPDDDSLTQAELGFRPQNFRVELDVLTFSNTGNIKGAYDYLNGKIVFSGHAPVSEYEQVIKSVQYNHLNTLDPILELKTFYIRLNDGNVWGDAKERVIELEYTFIELEIPTGFTPNGDGSNDTWVITRPGGLDQLEEAIIKVFNRRGVQVFYKHGFDGMWDGTMNGETLPADTYFYTIDLHLRNKKTYKGIVTILR